MSTEWMQIGRCMLEQLQNSKAKDLAVKPVTVLIISSQESDALVIKQLLSTSFTHYAVRRADDLKQALRIIANGQCDVVLLSYFWQNLRIGGKFIKKAKSFRSSVPIIVFTPSLEVKIERQIVSAGAADYICLSETNSKQLDRTLRYALQRKTIVHQLSNLAYYDHLTKLPNRSLFQDRLSHAIRVAERDRQQFAVMLVDINGFKNINDNYGHPVGDKLLQAFAERLKKAVRKSDTVARVGGDEFILLFNRVGNVKLVEQLALKLLKEVKPEVDIDGETFDLHCSVGVAIYPQSGTDAKTLLKHADIAMYHAKKQSGNSYEFYSPEMELEKNFNESNITTEFLNALANNQIGLYFNPRFSCKNDQIVAIEVNPYWNHPQQGLQEYEQFDWQRLTPEVSSRFVEWLIATSFEYFKQLNLKNDIKLVFNIGFEDLLRSSFSQMVSSKLKRYGIDGRRIEFDLSNVRPGEFPNGLLELSVADLTRLGVSFGMNDFGVDNLSLMILDVLPISLFKLDKRLIDHLFEAGSQLTLIRALVDMAHKLDVDIAVEGHHHHLPVNTIKETGFDYYKSIFSVDLNSLESMQSMINENTQGHTA